MIRSENVHCNSANVVPSFWLRGPVNNVQTYCGDEIAIIATNPSPSWFHRFQYQAVGIAGAKAVMTSFPLINSSVPAAIIIALRLGDRNEGDLPSRLSCGR